MSVLVESKVARVCRDYLLRTLPAKVAALNTAAILRAPYAGPYVIAAGRTLTLNVGGSDVPVALTSGTRTATQVAADINASITGLASEDLQGRLLLTSQAAPSIGTPSVIRVQPDPSAAINEVFGWERGGSWVVVSALAAPTYRAFCDGWPIHPSFGGPGVINIVIDDRRSAPTQPGPRHDEYIVDLDLVVFRADPDSYQASKEGIHRAVQAVRELLLSDTGRRFGIEDTAIGLVEERGLTVKGAPISFENMPGIQYDAAVLRLGVRIFERQS